MRAPSLSLALDEPKATDAAFSVSGITYLADKALNAGARHITIDFTPVGFKVYGHAPASDKQSVFG